MSDEETSERDPAAPRRLTIFRGKDAVDLDFEMMPIVGLEMPDVQEGVGKLMAAGVQPGVAERAQVVFRDPRPDGMSLIRAWFKSGYVLPRHSHSADCLYYVVAGSLRMGSVTLRPGDGVFVPKDMAYTYDVGEDGLELLEFRNVSSFNFIFKGNDAAHWDRMADNYRERASIWQEETTLPSERVPA